MLHSPIVGILTLRGQSPAEKQKPDLLAGGAKPKLVGSSGAPVIISTLSYRASAPLVPGFTDSPVHTRRPSGALVSFVHRPVLVPQGTFFGEAHFVASHSLRFSIDGHRYRGPIIRVHRSGSAAATGNISATLSGYLADIPAVFP